MVRILARTLAVFDFPKSLRHSVGICLEEAVTVAFPVCSSSWDVDIVQVQYESSSLAFSFLNALSYTSTLQYVFKAWYSVMPRDNFVLAR